MHNSEVEVTDFVLIARYLSGDTQSFDEIVRRYEKKVISLCFKYLRDYYEAQDCTQEIFLKLHRNLGTFKKNAKFSTWLFTVSINCCKNRIKWLNVRNFFKNLSLNKKLDEISDEEFIDHIKDENTPESVFEQKERHKILNECMKVLKHEHCAIIHMKDKEEMSYKEICEITGYSLPKIKTVIHRSRLRIAEEYKRIYGVDNE